MTTKIECVKKLKNYYPDQSVFQEFQHTQDKTSHEIMECFEELDYKDIVDTGFAIDYLLFYLVNQPEKTIVGVQHAGTVLNSLFSGSTAVEKYLDPIEKLAAKQTATSAVAKYRNSLKNGQAFSDQDIKKTMLSIFLYQVYRLIYNFSKSYPISYSKSVSNSQSLIYSLLAKLDLTWPSIHSAMEDAADSAGFKGFHSGVNLSSIITEAKSAEAKQLVTVCRRYVRLVGLYMSYQVHKYNEAPTVPAQPLFPPNGTEGGKIETTGIKTPFKIDEDLNTFEVPKAPLEVDVKDLSDVDEKDKYEPTSNLITYEDLKELIEKDSFILDLVKSEMKLMQFKLATYNKMKADIEENLKAGNLDPKIKGALEKKLGTIDIILAMVTKRANTLKTTGQALKIKNKRQSIENIINNKDNGILSIKGETRDNVRRYMYSQIYIFSKAPELYIKNFMNYTLMGPAGSGKTKVAGVLAYMYNHLGILASESENGKFLIVTRADLVAGYIGQTAPKTRDYLEKILEGVLLIDEAYQVSGCPDKEGQFSSQDFGQEAITEIVNYIDKNIGLSVIIAAGYEKQITDCFLAINEGMKRRFPNNMRLLIYSDKDLFEILMKFISEKSQVLTESQTKYIFKLIQSFNDEKVKYEGDLLFANQAGDMLNLANQLLDDYVLLKSEGYGIKDINQSFQKFFANKGIYIEFTTGQEGGMSWHYDDESEGGMPWYYESESEGGSNEDINQTYKTLEELQRGIYRLVV